MEEKGSNNAELLSRIGQLELEKDALQKDIEQLCIQQAGPAYLVVATKMHFQRTAVLEQEIENLKKKLSVFMKENSNLQEELAEAYHIKTRFAELLNEEVSKNKEAEKQLNFFQGCMAAAFSERDHSVLEAEKAKEREEDMLRKMNETQSRFDVLIKGLDEEKSHNAELQKELIELKESTKLEEEKLMELKMSNLTLQNKLNECHRYKELLRKDICILEAKNVRLEDTVHKGLLMLHHVNSQRRNEILALLEEWKTTFQSEMDLLFKNGSLSETSIQTNNTENYELECKDVHMTSCAAAFNATKAENFSSEAMCSKSSDDAYKALAQALQEKVDALLLLSQQEEQSLLQKNIQAALEKKCEDLQRTLVQVTNEKVKALLELAQLRQDYQLLKEDTHHAHKLGHATEKEGRIKSLLKRSNLNQWIGFAGVGSSPNADYREIQSTLPSNCSMDVARLKVENASLQESISSIQHLTSCLHKLRLLLIKAGHDQDLRPEKGQIEQLDEIIFEANLMRTAIGSSLPVSWSAEDDSGSFGEGVSGVMGGNNKIDCVSAAGYEMVELLIMAALSQKENLTQKT